MTILLLVSWLIASTDSVAVHCTVKEVVRVSGKTSDVLRDVLTLLPLDVYDLNPVSVMDRVQKDKDDMLEVPAYSELKTVSGVTELNFIERFEFYECAKASFVVIQTDDCTKYANVIVRRGVV